MNTLKTATIYANDGNGWIKIATHKIDTAKTLMNDIQYFKIVQNTGFDEIMDLCAIDDFTGEVISKLSSDEVEAIEKRYNDEIQYNINHN